MEPSRVQFLKEVAPQLTEVLDSTNGRMPEAEPTTEQIGKLKLANSGKFPDSDFGSESLSAQLRENFYRAHTYIFSPSCTLIGAILLHLAVACCTSLSLYRLLSRNVIMV